MFGGNSQKHPSHALARLALRGDRDAFERLFRELHPVVYRFALSRCENDVEAAEEITQNTLTRTMRKLATFRGESALLTWCLTLCRHEISDYYNRLGKRRREQVLDELDHELQAVLDSLSMAGETPEASTRARETARLVRRALDYLPARQRVVLELKYLEDCSVQEIARREQVTDKAVESLLSRGRQSFREAFLSLTRSTSYHSGART